MQESFYIYTVPCKAQHIPNMGIRSAFTQSRLGYLLYLDHTLQDTIRTSAEIHGLAQGDAEGATDGHQEAAELCKERQGGES